MTVADGFIAAPLQMLLHPEISAPPMRLFVKNMVCDRCKMVVRAELERHGLHPLKVELGQVDIEEAGISPERRAALDHDLHNLGFALIEDRKRRIAEQVKAAIIVLIHQQNDDSRIKHSEYLAQQTGLDYAYLSKVFSEEEGLTIEQYIILQKIEKVKELLTYGQQSLSEIAWQLGYSSVAALSAQFKKVVGMTPTAWKAEARGRKELDRVGK
jgi:AraC-like DNA-binding protein